MALILTLWKTYSRPGPSCLPENCAIQGSTWTLPFKARYDEEVQARHPQQTNKTNVPFPATATTSSRRKKWAKIKVNVQN